MSPNNLNLLDRAIEAINAEEPSFGPSPDLVNQTLFDVRNDWEHSPSHMHRILAVAAAVAITIGLGALIWLISLPATPAFTWGDVLATVSQAHTMTCRITLNGKNATSETGTLMLKFPGLRREELPDWIFITNWPAHKSLNLNAKKKIAVISNLTGDHVNSNPVQTFDELKNLKESQPLGSRMIDGKSAVGFRFIQPLHGPGATGQSIEDIWADAKTHRILQCTIDSDISFFDPQHPWSPSRWKKEKFHTQLDNYQWDIPLDDHLFSITPPPGYKIEHGNVRVEVIK